MIRSTVILGVLLSALCATRSPAQSPTEPHAKAIRYYNYTEAIELRHGKARVVLCPQAGGRVLEFSIDARQALYLDEREKDWQPDTKGPASAGRFDYGPELTVAPHPTIWSGAWRSEITGPCSARLTSPVEPGVQMQVVRDFELVNPSTATQSLPLRLDCRQTLVNLGPDTREVCHWGRSFSPGGGICLIPLGDHLSRFPSKYAMYEEGSIINVKNTDEKIRERDGFLEILAPPRKPKLGFDSYAGWLAYLLPNHTLFVKRFATFPDRVYNEAAGLTLSVWYPEGPRIELEPIGPRERLAPGQRASFTEAWWLLEYPFPQTDEAIDLTKLREQVLRQTSPIE